MPESDEIGDHIEIVQVLQRYCTALDEKDYALLDGVFVPGARLHYAMRGGAESTHPEMVQVFRDFNARFLFTQHLLGPAEIELEGDRARSRTNLRALHVQITPSDERSTWIVNGVYRDVHERTPSGWRICQRSFRALHVEGVLLPPERVRCFQRPPTDLNEP
jgi:hypothetical protein